MKLFENRTTGSYSEGTTPQARITRTTTPMGNVYWMFISPFTSTGVYCDPVTFDNKYGEVRAHYKYASGGLQVFQVPLHPDTDPALAK